MVSVFFVLFMKMVGGFPDTDILLWAEEEMIERVTTHEKLFKQ